MILLSTNLEDPIFCNNIIEYHIKGYHPQIFKWAENARQAAQRLPAIYNSSLREELFISDYGPHGIKKIPFKSNYVQLDRAQMLWSLLTTNIFRTENPLLIEFGCGTGQMADIAKTFPHICFDLQPMLILQNQFLKLRRPSKHYLPLNLLDSNIYHSHSYATDEITDLISYKTNRNIVFIATYSLTETDLATRKAVLPLLKRSNTIYILYWPRWKHNGDNINNELYIESLIRDLSNTHNPTRLSTLNGRAILFRQKS